MIGSRTQTLLMLPGNQRDSKGSGRWGLDGAGQSAARSGACTGPAGHLLTLRLGRYPPGFCPENRRRRTTTRLHFFYGSSVAPGQNEPTKG